MHFVSNETSAHLDFVAGRYSIGFMIMLSVSEAWSCLMVMFSAVMVFCSSKAFLRRVFSWYRMPSLAICMRLNWGSPVGRVRYRSVWPWK